MQQRHLGNSGLRVSLAGLGCNNFGARIDTDAARKVVHKALDLGITLLDTADIYGNKGGSETALGEILGPRRKDIVLATKFGLPMDDSAKFSGGSRRYIMSAVEASLKRLKTDWIDLYQLHRPDAQTPLAETLGTLDDLVRAGKIRYAGCSNLPAWQVADSTWIARDARSQGFVSCQDNYSMLERRIEAELIPAMQHFGLGLLPYFPLASGLLTGKYQRGTEAADGTRLAQAKDWVEMFISDDNWTRIERFRSFAEERDQTLLNLALSWLAARPTVSSIIAGATKPEQVEANVAALDWVLSDDDLAEIDTLTKISKTGQN